MTDHSEAAPPRATTPEPMTLRDAVVEYLAAWDARPGDAMRIWNARDALRATLASSPPGAVAGAESPSKYWCRTCERYTRDGQCDCVRPAAPSSEIAGLLDDLEYAVGQWTVGNWKRDAVDALRATLTARIAEAERDAEAYRRINTPEIDDFLSAVRNEALHQRERWGADQDGGKTDADWFWLVGYLSGKALHDVKGKRLHHIITSAAALLNWHAHAVGAYARMRPGIEDPDAARASRSTGDTINAQEPSE